MLLHKSPFESFVYNFVYQNSKHKKNPPSCPWSILLLNLGFESCYRRCRFIRIWPKWEVGNSTTFKIRFNILSTCSECTRPLRQHVVNIQLFLQLNKHKFQLNTIGLSCSVVEYDGLSGDWWHESISVCYDFFNQKSDWTYIQLRWDLLLCRFSTNHPH